MSAAGRGYALVAVAATLWGVNGSASRLAISAGLDGSHLAQLRMTAAAALLLVWALARDASGLRTGRREAGELVVFGVLGLALVQWLYFEALARIEVGLALTIEYTAPLLVALWWRARGRPLPAGVWVAMLAALAGLALAVGLVGGTAGQLSGVGVLAACGTAAAYALYVILAERHVARRSSVSLLALGMLAGAAFWALVQPWWDFPFGVLGHSEPLGRVGVDVPVALVLAYVVVLGTVVPFALLVSGVARIGGSDAALTATLEPVVAAACAWALLGQRLTWLQLVGGAVVLAAVGAAQRVRLRAASSLASAPPG